MSIYDRIILAERESIRRGLKPTELWLGPRERREMQIQFGQHHVVAVRGMALRDLAHDGIKVTGPSSIH
jgi:hypothetical protein